MSSTQKTSKLFLYAVLALSARFGVAQSTFGSFVGTVKDPSGAAVAGCMVTVHNVGTSPSRSVVADGMGTYTVVNLEPGTYEIAMEMKGFQREVYSNVALQARQTVRVDGSLILRAQTQVVEVSTAREAPISTEVSNIAESKQ